MNSPGRLLEQLRALCLALPHANEGSSFGHPVFRAGKKAFAALEIVAGRPSIAFRSDPDDAERQLRRKQFFRTPYGRGLWVSMWADTALDWRLVGDLLECAYREVALKRMIAALDAERATAARPPRR
jgi:predicted DNA-binding protein (MmcQ/YjbR family)